VIQQQGKPLAFYSRKLTDTQTRYTVIELELLAIVETLQEYQTILYGHLINVYTDHKNLTFANFNTDRVRRWRLIVEEYGPKIIYLEGKKNVVADFLSRHPMAEKTVNEVKFFDSIFQLEDEAIFPLSFDIISDHQTRDKALQEIATNNPNYVTKIVGNQTLIYLDNKLWFLVPYNDPLWNGTTQT
jgi:RNase H-like domain found in reverse transcriptase